MPSVFTESLRLEEQGIGENDNTWGNKANSTFRMIDKAIAGHVSVAVASGTVTLTAVNNAEDESRYRIVELTGTLTANVVVQVPEVSKEYIVWDSTTRGGFTITFRLGAAGGTVAIPATTTRAFGISSDGSVWRPLSAELASETTPGIVELATDAEGQAGTSETTVLTPAVLQAITATETRKGVIELATSVEAQTGTDTDRAITPATLQAVTATETRKGVAEVATTTEARTGTDNERIITPLRLQEVTATESRAGVIEVATSAEAAAGADDTRAITPLKLEQIIGTMAKRDVTISTAGPSGGVDGQVWFQY